MYTTPVIDQPPRRLPIIAAALAIACLGYGAAHWLINTLDHDPIRYLIIPAVALCMTYAILAEYLEFSGAYEKDPALGGMALIICPIIGAMLLAGLYFAALKLRLNHKQLEIIPTPTPLTRLGDLILARFALFAILPWLGALAIALFGGLRRRKPRQPAIAHGLVDQLGPAPGDNAA